MLKTILTTLISILLIAGGNNFAQQKSNRTNLLGGAIQENGLPAGWITAVDNYECAVKFDGNSIYFERQVKDEKCSFAFTKEMPDGEYLLETNFKIDGNGHGIFLDGVPLKKQHKIKSVDGKIRVGIQTKGEGKVWGWIRKMTLTKTADAKKSTAIKMPTTVIKAKGISNAAIEKIKKAAADCPCRKYAWKNRGKAPIGYIKGVALTYAKSYHDLKTSPSNAVKIMSQKIGGADKDALAHHGKKGNSDIERLRAIYTLALGLGMRESTGNTTDGRDMSVPAENATEANAEAGLFQVSYDSFGRSSEFPTLFNWYKVNAEECRLSVFMEGVKDKNRPLVGGGKGAEFQRFTKECPAFATDYVMIMLRINRSHFGPINKKEAEYNADAEKMFKKIESIVDAETNS